MRIIATPAFSNRGLNPYNWLLYGAVGRLGHQVRDGFWIWTDWRADVWHVHWPEEFLCNRSIFSTLAGMAFAFLNAGICRVLGVRIVWTVHNLQPHERHWPLLERVFYAVFPRLVDRFVFLSETTRHAGMRRMARIRAGATAVIPHGHYRDILGRWPDRNQARARLGLDNEVSLMLFFGQIRQYKNVPSLMRTFSAMAGSNLRLAVVGSAGGHDALRDEVLRMAEGDDRIIADLRHVPDEELAAWVSAANLVVLPYRDIANSGSAMLALSIGRPVLVPDKGAMGELQARLGGKWVRVYQGELTPQELASAIAWSMAAGCDGPDLNGFEWDKIAQATVAVYEGARRKAAD